jgi:hypothetical protein
MFLPVQVVKALTGSGIGGGEIALTRQVTIPAYNRQEPGGVTQVCICVLPSK